MRRLAWSLALSLLTADLGVAADVVAPGTVIDRDNVDGYAQYFGPGMVWVIKHGMRIRVIAPRAIEHPPAVRAATERYAGQVTLSPDGTHILNHVAGIPFTTIDPNEEFVANKLMFNFASAIVHDDSDIRNFDCDTGTVGKNGSPIHVERHFLIDHIRRLYFVERTEVDPKPKMANRDEARFKEALYPLIEPLDLKGVGFTFNRYLDHTRHDDTWLYLPQLRRVRRLSSAQRSDALFGQDADADSYEGYQGNVAWMTWKFLGEKTILASMHAENMPVKWHAPSADFIHDEGWEPREAWIIEGESKLPQYAYGKRVIYLDKQIYRIPYTDIYDHAGELWKMWVNNYKFDERPFPGAEHGFDWEVAYRPSITMLDMQIEHSTNCALPSAKFPGEQGWYINLGDSEGTVEDWFTLAAIIAAGR